MEKEVNICMIALHDVARDLRCVLQGHLILMLM